MKYLLLLTTLLLTGCQKANIYLYGKHISEQEAAKLTAEFEQAGYRVEVNQHAFPKEVSSTSLLYSPLLRNRESINEVQNLLIKQGLEVNSISSLIKGNHLVTKDAIAVFVVSDPRGIVAPVVKGQAYSSHKCDSEYHIDIASTKTAEVSEQESKKKVVWRLLANQEIFQMTDDRGYNFNYEIHKSVSQTPVGVVDEITLKPVVRNSWFGDCEFYSGVVRADA